MKYIVTFHTHFDALQYNKLLAQKDIKGKLRPVPRALSSSCGTCVEFCFLDEINEQNDLLEEEYEKIFFEINNKYVLIAKK